MSTACARDRIPAPPSIVCEYILQILCDGRTLKRSDLVREAQKLAARNGFFLESSKAIATVKKALSTLADRGKITSPRIGWYQIAVQVEQWSPENKPADSNSFQDEDEAETVSDSKLAIERQIGDGIERVYVYYHESDRKLAELQGREVWECKVGFTVGDPDARIIGQGAMTCFPRPPKIGLLIRTNDARALETILHGALTAAGKRINDSGGSEWFITSPNRIERWILSFQQGLTILS